MINVFTISGRLSMKLSSLTAIFLASSASIANSGGFETNALSTSFMYEDGNYAETSFSSRSPEVKGTVYAPNGSALKKQNSVSFALKGDFSSNLAFGVTSYNQGAIQLDYSDAGSAAAAFLPVVDLTIDSIAVLAKYSFTENLGIIGGIKQTRVKDATADIFQSVGISESLIAGGNELGYVIGASYSVPSIVLRAELLYENDTDFSLDTTDGRGRPGKTTGSTPGYMTLNFQSGIAEGTLLFGSIRRANWSKHQLKVWPDQSAATSSFKDTTTYSLGVGQKVNESLSVILKYSTEPAGSSASTTPLTITNGYKAIGLAARYSYGNATITAGYSYGKIGDTTLTTTALGAGKFTDNTVKGFGIKVGYNF